MRFPLLLEPYETKVVVVGPPAGGGGPGGAEPSWTSGTTLAELSGDWALELNGKQLTTPLKSWEDLGTPILRRPGCISQAVQFARGAHREESVPGNRRCARLRPDQGERRGLRGPRPGSPIAGTSLTACKPGNNDVQINVFATSAGRGGPAVPPPGAAPGRGCRGGRPRRPGRQGRAGRPRCRGHARWRISRRDGWWPRHPNAAGFGLARTSPSGSAVGARPLGLFLASGRAGACPAPTQRPWHVSPSRC